MINNLNEFITTIENNLNNGESYFEYSHTINNTTIWFEVSIFDGVATIFNEHVINKPQSYIDAQRNNPEDVISKTDVLHGALPQRKIKLTNIDDIREYIEYELKMNINNYNNTIQPLIDKLNNELNEFDFEKVAKMYDYTMYLPNYLLFELINYAEQNNISYNFNA